MRNRQPDRNADAARDAALEAKYRGAVSLVEMAYRQYLKLLKLELEQMGIQDISNVQSIGLFNIGTGEKAIGDLDECHSGWNVHHNARELVKKGYLVRTRSPNDGRSRRVKLSEKGDALRDRLSEMHRRHLEQLRQTSIAEADLRATAATLLRLEEFWAEAAAAASRKPAGPTGIRNSPRASGVRASRAELLLRGFRKFGRL